MIKFEGNLYWDGKDPKIQARDKFVEWLKQFPADQWFRIDVVLLGAANNTSQSKLYHKWCDIIQNEFGWDSKDEVHEYLKKTYNSGKSTKAFGTKEWSEYMIKVQAFANSHNINLPIGNEES